jgi:hypothetical protein
MIWEKQCSFTIVSPFGLSNFSSFFFILIIKFYLFLITSLQEKHGFICCFFIQFAYSHMPDLKLNITTLN